MSPARGEGPEFLFETAHVVADLRRLVVQGGLLKLLSQAAKFGMRVAGLVVMARLVTPGDYGVFAMVATLTSLIALLKDAGLSAATVQSKTITHEEISTLFWINVAVGAALACVTAALAPVLARFYGDPRIIAPVTAMGISFFFSAFATQHTALLQRQMRFKALESIGVASQFAGAAVMIVSAYFGARYWSLVLNVLAMQAANTLLILAASGWRPGAPSRSGGYGTMLRFGRDLSGFRLVSYFQRNLDNILIGRYCSSIDLGLYSKAYGLLRLPIMQIQEPIASLVVPALSRLQDDPKRYRNYFLKATQAVVFVGMPLVAFTALAARETLLLLLGERWLGAVPIFQAMIPAAFVGTMDMITRWIFLSRGRTDLMLRVGALSFMVVAAAFVCGLPGGPVGVATAYSVAYCLVSLPSMAFALKQSPITPGDVFSAVWRPAAISIATALLVLGMDISFTGPQAPALQFALKGALYGGVYTLLWVLIPGGRRYIGGIAVPAFDAIRGFARKPRSVNA